MTYPIPNPICPVCSGPVAYGQRKKCRRCMNWCHSFCVSILKETICKKCQGMASNLPDLPKIPDLQKLPDLPNLPDLPKISETYKTDTIENQNEIIKDILKQATNEAIEGNPDLKEFGNEDELGTKMKEIGVKKIMKLGKSLTEAKEILSHYNIKFKRR